MCCKGSKVGIVVAEIKTQNLSVCPTLLLKRVGTRWRTQEWLSQMWVFSPRRRKLPRSIQWLVGSLSSIHRPRLGCMLGRVAIMKCCHAQIENTHDGKKANFPEGRLGLTTRYICYTKKSASPQRVSAFVVPRDALSCVV